MDIIPMFLFCSRSTEIRPMSATSKNKTFEKTIWRHEKVIGTVCAILLKCTRKRLEQYALFYQNILNWREYNIVLVFS